MGTFKLDENLSAALREPLALGGHDVATVEEQHLRGAGTRRSPLFAVARGGV
jgi:hypothetical protein